MTEVCSICKVPTNKRCSRCHAAYYCSREHQQKDWSVHRASCRPYKVDQSESLGRHLVATRDLQRGETVLREQPLLTGPAPSAQQPLCVACYRPPPASVCDPFAQCPRKCGWPLCGEACADSPRHEPECQLQAKRPNQLDVRGALAAGRPVYRALMVARALLLRDSDQVVYAKLRSMEAHCAKRRASGAWECERVTLAQFLLSFFGLEERFSATDVLYMAGVLQVNTYPVLVNGRYLVAVYDEASFIEHNCKPNVAKVFSADGALLLRVATPVVRGSHLSICYVDARLGTAPRRRRLADELLSCLCSRCEDPTELNTGFSSLRCPSTGCSGEVSQSQPIAEALPKGGDTDWRCGTCSYAMPPVDADAALNEAAVAAAAAAGGVQDAADFLGSPAARRLAANHYLLLGARVAVACGNGPAAERSDAQLAAAESELRGLLKLVDALLPGEAGLHGNLLYNLYEIVLEIKLRSAKGKGLSTKEVLQQVQEAKYFLKESVSSLEDFSEEVLEGKLRIRAQKQLNEFESLLEGALTSAKSLVDDVTSFQASAATTTLATVVS